MFTGIIESLAKLLTIEKNGDNISIVGPASYVFFGDYIYG